MILYKKFLFSTANDFGDVQVRKTENKEFRKVETLRFTFPYFLTVIAFGFSLVDLMNKK